LNQYAAAGQRRIVISLGWLSVEGFRDGTIADDELSS